MVNDTDKYEAPSIYYVMDSERDFYESVRADMAGCQIYPIYCVRMSAAGLRKNRADRE